MGYPDYFCLFLPIFDISSVNYTLYRMSSESFSMLQTFKMDVLASPIVQIDVGLKRI